MAHFMTACRDQLCDRVDTQNCEQPDSNCESDTSKTYYAPGYSRGGFGGFFGGQGGAGG
jgi:hypothetical protein